MALETEAIMRVAAGQFETQLLDPAANLATMNAYLERAASQGVQLVAFPECAVTGYALTAKEAARLAEPIPGPSTQALVQSCRRLGLFAVVGLLEQDADGILFNSAALLGPEGVIGVYRKTHLPCLGVDRYLACGDDLPGPFPLAEARLGLLICYDLRLPEPMRVLALAGAQLVVVSTAWPSTARLYSEHLARTRAAENGVFLLAANHVGEERGTRYLGNSLIIGPDGEVLQQAGEQDEALLVAEIDLGRADRKQRVFIPGEYELDLIADRRPDLYRRLADTEPHTPSGGSAMVA
jgi:5-aminopentanamidase